MTREQQLARLLEHAATLITDESGMVVCWHELTADEALQSDCIQCCVEHALSLLPAVSPSLHTPAQGFEASTKTVDAPDGKETPC